MINIYETKLMKKYLKDRDGIDNVYNTGFNLRQHYGIIAPTGTGKSNCIINLLGTAFYNKFHYVYLFTAYDDEEINNMLSAQENCFIRTYDKLPPCEELFEGEKLIIFDDFMAQNKKVMSELINYATRSRKLNCTCLYLAQDFFGIEPKIRKQFAFLIFLKMKNKNDLSQICSRIPHDVEINKLKDIINNATKYKFSTCIIDLNSNDITKTFRRNFYDYYNPNNLILYDNQPNPHEQIQQFIKDYNKTIDSYTKSNKKN